MAATAYTNEDFEEMAAHVTSTLAKRIEVRMAQSGCRLFKGTPEATAKKQVSKWSFANVIAFYKLAKNAQTMSTSALAKASGSSTKNTSSWWHGLKVWYVRGVPRDGIGEPIEIQLFRYGHERFWASDGVKLQLNSSMLLFDVARLITDSTRAQTRATRMNYEGGCRAQESDESRTEEERTEARRRLDDEMRKPAVATIQEPLFGGIKKK